MCVAQKKIDEKNTSFFSQQNRILTGVNLFRSVKEALFPINFPIYIIKRALTLITCKRHTFFFSISLFYFFFSIFYYLVRPIFHFKKCFSLADLKQSSEFLFYFGDYMILNRKVNQKLMKFHWLDGL